MRSIDRRRFITIAAATAGLPLLTRVPAARAAPAAVWHGRAMGAQTTLILNHPDPARARTLLRAVRAEVDRLEDIFSLYRAGSELSRLNRTRALAAPSAELLGALRLSARVHAATGGRFDPSVQPLWAAYAAGGDPAALDRARGLIGFDRVRLGEARITLPAGMALTLNGMAQGVITDRVTDLLRAAGARHTLVDMGEIRALGTQPHGQPWRVGLAGGDGLDIVDRAVAVSEPAGFTFDTAGALPHLIDPAAGTPSARWTQIAVIAPEAALADALSTGLAVADEASIRAALSRLPGVRVRAVSPEGRQLVL